MKRAPSVLAGLALAGLLGACGSSGTRAPDAASQTAFGVAMAQQGLWSEALFRFERAHDMEGPRSEALNNLAVASEALGRFDQALEYYREALALDPGNRDLKNNYDRFVSFYESFQPRQQPAAEEATESPDQASGETPGDPS